MLSVRNQMHVEPVVFNDASHNFGANDKSNRANKGAIALANGLASDDEIHLVALSGGWSGSEGVDSRVIIRCPDKPQGFFQKLKFFRSVIKDLNVTAQNSVCISYCFSADIVNLLCNSGSKKVSSVRGNLPLIYRLDYGVLGWCVAYFHFFCLRRFDLVVSMSHSMKEQLRRVARFALT